MWWDAISDKCLLLGVFKHGKKSYILFVSSFIYLLQITEKYVELYVQLLALYCVCMFVYVCVCHNVVEDTKVTIN